jgi:hypothetical protein
VGRVAHLQEPGRRSGFLALGLLSHDDGETKRRGDIAGGNTGQLRRTHHSKLTHLYRRSGEAMGMAEMQ